MILIADSGSTKTTWCAYDKTDGTRLIIRTAGINPVFIDKNVIEQELRDNLMSQLPPHEIDTLYFYGAGCIDPTVNNNLAELLADITKAKHVEVASDMLGAARALFGNERGIACILGTGSNSCLYDGTTIIANGCAGGYILGDEGSGAVLGKQLIADFIKRQLPEEISTRFTKRYGLTYPDIVNHVYRQPMPNRWLASFAPFIKENINNDYIHQLVKSQFILFINRNIKRFDNYQTANVGFVGSIAYHFSDILHEAAIECGITVVKVIKEPL